MRLGDELTPGPLRSRGRIYDIGLRLGVADRLDVLGPARRSGGGQLGIEPGADFGIHG